MPRAPKWNRGSKQDLLTALQGYYSTIVLSQLGAVGALRLLAVPQNYQSLAKQLGIDPAMTKHLLDFVVLTTNVVNQTRNGKYQLKEPHYAELSFQLEKFAGAYGPAVNALEKSLRDPHTCAKYVDDRALATAFAEVAVHYNSVVTELIEAAGVNCLLDLGCGPASLLITLAQRNPEFHGVGLDSSRNMCARARAAVRLAGVARQIEIYHASGEDPRRKLSPSLRAKVDAIYGGSFLNAFFGQTDRKVVKVLQTLRRTFPGRRAWFVDYYSSIGQAKRKGELGDFPLALLQDLAQVASGQGVPPADAKMWRGLYEQAGCRLRRISDFERREIRWFIHELTF